MNTLEFLEHMAMSPQHRDGLADLISMQARGRISPTLKFDNIKLVGWRDATPCFQSSSNGS